MVSIKPGQSGVVSVLWDCYGCAIVPDAGTYAFDDASSSTSGFTASYSPTAELFTNNPVTGSESSSNTITAVVDVPLGATSGTHTLYISSSDGNSDGLFDRYRVDFNVTGDLTGSFTGASWDSVATDPVTFSLKADTATGNTVTSIVIDFDDGDTTTLSPGVQHYTGSVSHTFPGSGTYTVSAVFTDSESNTVTSTIDICIDADNSSTIDAYEAWFGVTNVAPQIELVQTSSTLDESTGIYTNCYSATIYPYSHLDGSRPSLYSSPVTEANRGSFFYNANWTLPSNATTSDDLTGNVGPISFCVPQSTADGSDDLSLVECDTPVLGSGSCPFPLLAQFPAFAPATRTGAGGGFWMMM